MNIRQRVVAQLEQLAAEGPTSVEAVVRMSPRPGYIVGIPPEGEGFGVSLNIDDYDRYSAKLRQMEMYNNSLAVTGDKVEAYLQQCSSIIIERLTYLDEPLALLELNTAESEARLRSTPPRQTANGSIYWEAHLWLGPHPRLKLRRFRWTADLKQRAPLAYPTTFASLGRIAEDVASSMERAYRSAIE